MSKKRQASNELNHDNWDDADPEEQKEMGSFGVASKEVLEKRVIKTAKRRTQVSNEEKNSIFSGFGGFNKPQSTSFDFLSNLTNGNRNNISTKIETPMTSSLLTNKPQPSTPGTTTQSPSLFASSDTIATSSIFSSTTDTAVNNLPVKTQPVFSTGGTNNAEITKVTNASTIIMTPQVTSSIFGTPTAKAITKPINNTSTPNSSPFTTQSTLKNSTDKTVVASTSNPEKNNGKEKIEESKLQYFAKLKCLNESVLEWIKKHVDETPLCILSPIFKDYENHLKKIQSEYESSAKIDKVGDKTDTEKNKSVETLTTPKTVSVLANTNNTIKSGTSLFNTENSKKSLFAPSVNNSLDQKTKGFSFGINNSSINTSPVVASTSSGFTFGIKNSSINTSPVPISKNSELSVGGLQSSTHPAPVAVSTSSGFSFGIKNSSINSSPTSVSKNSETVTLNKTSTNSSPLAVSTNSGFSFGIKPVTTPSTPTTLTKPNSNTTSPQLNVTSSPFSFTTTSPKTLNGVTPFSFGINKPFSFGSNTCSPIDKTEKKNEENDGKENEDTPPKVEHTPIAEENSVFDKRCKIFVKKDANFIDKGVGTLYIKKIEDSDKYQLLVRANTSLGNVLLNLRLSSSIPTQKMGKNNVMIVCIPTPETKPPPIPVLIRVKTSEEADELLEVLNKHKK